MASAESARSGGGGSSSAAGAQEACAQGTPGCCSEHWCSEQRKGPVCNRCATEVDGVLDPHEYVCAYKHQTETELYEGALDDAIWCALDNHGLRPLNAAEGGEVVLNIGARRNKLDVYSWVGHELVELIFHPQEFNDERGDKHPAVGHTGGHGTVVPLPRTPLILILLVCTRFERVSC